MKRHDRRMDELDLRRTPRLARWVNESQEIAESAIYDDSCPFCEHWALSGRNCKVWCDQCGNLVRTCADL